jgi:hypothetical protein
MNTKGQVKIKPQQCVKNNVNIVYKSVHTWSSICLHGISGYDFISYLQLCNNSWLNLPEGTKLNSGYYHSPKNDNHCNSYGTSYTCSWQLDFISWVLIHKAISLSMLIESI